MASLPVKNLVLVATQRRPRTEEIYPLYRSTYSRFGAHRDECTTLSKGVSWNSIEMHIASASLPIGILRDVPCALILVAEDFCPYSAPVVAQPGQSHSDLCLRKEQSQANSCSASCSGGVA